MDLGMIMWTFQLSNEEAFGDSSGRAFGGFGLITCPVHFMLCLFTAVIPVTRGIPQKGIAILASDKDRFHPHVWKTKEEEDQIKSVLLFF